MSGAVKGTARLQYRKLRPGLGNPSITVTHQPYVQCVFRGHSVRDAVITQEHTSEKAGQNSPVNPGIPVPTDLTINRRQMNNQDRRVKVNTAEKAKTQEQGGEGQGETGMYCS